MNRMFLYVLGLLGLLWVGCAQDAPPHPKVPSQTQTTTLNQHGQDRSKDDHDGHDDHDDHDDHDGHKHQHNTPASADDHGDDHKEGTVHLSKEAIERSGIRIRSVRKGSLSGSLSVPAEVQLNPDQVAHMSPLVEGQLTRVDAKLGDRVEVGQTLARLRSVELGQARAELNRTSALLDVARKTRARQVALRSEGINSKRSLLESELMFQQARAERDAALSKLRVFGVRGGQGPDMDLISPIGGVVVERHATQGENVSSEDTLFIISDLTRVWVMGQVYEQHIARVQKGMTATLTLNAYPNRSWTGTVDFMGSVLDQDTRALPIRVELDNTDGVLRPGLFGSLRLASNAGEKSAVVIPQTAVQTVAERSVVFVPGDEDGEFVAHPVTVGDEVNGEVEVLEGLGGGDRVVVEGAFVLKSELMRGELGHGHAH